MAIVISGTAPQGPSELSGELRKYDHVQWWLAHDSWHESPVMHHLRAIHAWHIRVKPALGATKCGHGTAHLCPRSCWQCTSPPPHRIDCADWGHFPPCRARSLPAASIPGPADHRRPEGKQRNTHANCMLFSVSHCCQIRTSRFHSCMGSMHARLRSSTGTG